MAVDVSFQLNAIQRSKYARLCQCVQSIAVCGAICSAHARKVLVLRTPDELYAYFVIPLVCETVSDAVKGGKAALVLISALAFFLAQLVLLS